MRIGGAVAFLLPGQDHLWQHGRDSGKHSNGDAVR